MEITQVKLVKTIEGKEIPRNKCIYYKNLKEYHEKGVTCFWVEYSDDPDDGEWYRLASGKIGLNYETGKYELIEELQNKKQFTEGIVDTKMTRAFFKRTETTVDLKDGYNITVTTPCINEEIAIKLGYIPCKWNELYFKKSNLTKEELKIVVTPRVIRYKNLQFDYTASKNNPAYRTIKDIYDKTEYPSLQRTSELSKFLFNKSFGIEFESCNGTISQKLLGPLGIVPLKDGSLRTSAGIEPYEYTTVPMSGDKGLQSIEKICKELTSKCEFDTSCSLHIHIGNIKFDQLTIIAYWILVQSIQEELYSIFPLYKTDEVQYLRKAKRYNQPLPDIGLLGNSLYKKAFSSKTEFTKETLKNFNKIFSFLTNNQVPEMNDSYNLDSFNHPLGGQKWGIPTRYHLVNFNSLIFSSNRTLEFRIHPPTFNHTKVVNWLFICIGIVTFAERNTKDIISRKIKPSLEDIMKGFYTYFGSYEFNDAVGVEIANYLNAYIRFRKEKVAEATKAGDVLAKNIEFDADAKFKFSNNVLSSLY